MVVNAVVVAAVVVVAAAAAAAAVVVVVVMALVVVAAAAEAMVVVAAAAVVVTLPCRRRHCGSSQGDTVEADLRSRRDSGAEREESKQRAEAAAVFNGFARKCHFC